MSKFIVKKGKVTKGRTLDVDLVEIMDDKSERIHPGVKCDQLVHDDLIKAFSKLTFHLVFLCDLKEQGRLVASDELEDTTYSDFNPEKIDNISVQAFTISGEDDHEGIVLVGQKKIGNKVLNLITPFQEYTDDDYQYAGELASDIQACVYEVEQYLFEGKYAVKQLDIPFEDGQEGGESEVTDIPAVSETKKGRKRKLKLESLSTEEYTVSVELPEKQELQEAV